MEQKYVPIIKTTDAELRGYGELSDTVKDRILPIFELTKSRKTKLEPYGNIEKRVIKIAELAGARPFILDLATHQSLQNYQIENLLQTDDGFENWYEFIQNHQELSIIPVIHVDVDDLQNTTLLAANLAAISDLLALRVHFDDVELPDFVGAIPPEILAKTILIIDAVYIDGGSFLIKRDAILDRINAVENIADFNAVVVASSSFPSTVPNHTPDCHDARGWFRLLEKELVRRVQEEVNVELVHGDYASIHPIRYDVSGGNWVPRIDFPRDEAFYYARMRRDDGGYAVAATHLVATDEYSYFSCWGCDEIEQAATGDPNGKSPAYWIAARLNMYITSQV